jgi:hypothetical protein
VVGDFRARQIGVFIGSALILVVAYLFVGWRRARMGGSPFCSKVNTFYCLTVPYLKAPRF